MSWLPTVEIYCVQTCQQLFLNRLRQVVSKQGIQFLLCGLNNGLKNVRASDQWGKIYDGCVSHFPEKEAQQKHATWHVTKQSAGSKNGHIFSEPLRNLTAVAVYAKEKTVSKQNNLLPKKSPVFFLPSKAHVNKQQNFKCSTFFYALQLYIQTRCQSKSCLFPTSFSPL